MNPERKAFLDLKRMPARANMEETAWLLGFAAHDIPILVQAGLLKPLGRPPLRGTKYFATMTVEQLRSDLKWLTRASDTIVQHWRNKNKDDADEDSVQRKHHSGGNCCHN